MSEITVSLEGGSVSFDSSQLPAGPPGPQGPPGTSGGVQVESIAAHGATGGNVAADTTGLRAAYQAATAAGGCRTVYIPPGSFDISSLNGAGISDVTFIGNGDCSQLVVSGQDAQGNWLDFSGACKIRFKNLKLVGGGASVVAKTLVLHAATAESYLNGIEYDHVTIDAYSSVAHVYVFGVGYNSGFNNLVGANGLTIRDSLFIQRENGPAQSVGQSAYTAALRLDGINSIGIASANSSVYSGRLGCTGIRFDNVNLVDAAVGCGNGTQSNNAAFVGVTCGLMSATGGSFQGLGNQVCVFSTNCEAVSIVSPVFAASDGGGNTVGSWLLFSGGSNGQFVIEAPFFSIPQRSFIAFDPPVNGLGGLQNSRIVSPDVGANPANLYFTLITSNAAPACNPWFGNVDFDCDGLNVQAWGNISGLLRNVGNVVTLGSDSSQHIA